MIEVRDHISHKTSRARVELQLRRSGPPLVVYGLGLVLLLLCLIFIGRNLPGGGGFTETRTVQFAVSDVTGVVPGRQEVRFKGIPAGKITGSELENGRPVLTVEIDKEYGEIYRDARAQMRPNTPLQDMYLDIVDRGTPGAGSAEEGGPVPADRTAASVNISDVLQVFDAETRVRLRTLFDQFGRGLDDRGASLQTAFAELVPLLRNARRFADQVTVREARTRRLVHNFAVLTRELGWRERELRTLVVDGGATLNTLQKASPDLDATLHALPPALGQLDTTFSAVRTILPDVDRALIGLEPAVDALPPALVAVRRLSDDARPALAALRPAVRRLSPLARELRPLSSGLATAIDELEPQAPAFDHLTRSVAACGFEIGRFWHWTMSVFGFGDARGVAPRGDASVGIDSPGATSAPRVTLAPACAGGTTIGGVPAKDIRP